MCGGDENLDYTIDTKDPTIKKKKAKKGSAAAGIDMTEEDPVAAVDWSGYKYEKDPELIVGFPNADEVFESKNVLEGINDDYQKKDKARTLKPRKQGAMKNVMSGDPDFDQEETG